MASSCGKRTLSDALMRALLDINLLIALVDQDHSGG
jgi:hypothetical protein